MSNDKLAATFHGGIAPTVGPVVNDTFEYRVGKVLEGISHTLVTKNKAYGNSALNPIRVFSTASTVEQLKVRIDDKLSRLMRGTNTHDVPEDTITDLIGYLVLLKVAQGNSDD